MRACSAASLQESKGRHVTGGPLRVLPCSRRQCDLARTAEFSRQRAGPQSDVPSARWSSLANAR